jgi:hypothetical protein
MAVKRLTLSRLVTYIAFLGIFAIAVRTPVDTDMYWHLRAGQTIIETRSIPQVDAFSWTMAGTPWVDVHWLSQVILYAVYLLLGMPGLALLVGVLTVVACIFVWKQMTGGVFLRAFLIILAAATASVNLTPRSQLATFVFLAAVSYLLYLYKWRQINRLWIMPLVFGLWVNMHGGYIAGFMLLGAMLAGEMIGNLLRSSSPESLGWRRWRTLLIVTIISAVVLLVNPYTSNALMLPFKTVNIGVLQDFIQEWASPNFHEASQQPMLWMLLLTLVAIGFGHCRLDLTDAATLAIFAYITFLAQRNIGLFALVCAPILSRHADAIFAHSRWGERRLTAGSSVLNVLVLAAIIFAVVLRYGAAVAPAAQSAAAAKILPSGAVEWIIQHKPDGPLFNSYNWGGYLLWRLGSDYPVYVDGRTDVYDDRFLRQFLTIVLVQPGFDRKLAQTGARLIVIERNSLLATFLARVPIWRTAYEDDLAVVFVRESF